METSLPAKRKPLIAAFFLISLCAVAALADADPPPPGAFTIVVLPDTQSYVIAVDGCLQAREAFNFSHCPLHDMFLRQTQWIVEHRVSHNIQYVVHVGDLVQNNVREEWAVAKEAFGLLDLADVRYAIATGNHDYGVGGRADSRNTLFNDYFGIDSPYANQRTVGGFFEEGRTENSYHTFAAGGRDWIILALEWGPRRGVIEWANQVLLQHPDHAAILVIHAYLYSDDTRYDFGERGTRQFWSPYTYGTASAPGGTSDGQDLWEELVSKHNFTFVFSGHVLNDGVGRLKSIGELGQTVHQMLANYQAEVAGSVDGGNGFLRLIQVMPDGETVRVRTYSPVVDVFKSDSDQQFSLALCELPSDPQQTVSACDIAGSFTITPESGEAPLEVHLDGGESSTKEGHSIISYEWDFGDGTTARGHTAAHTYERAGRFLIRLTVRDDRDLSATMDQSVTVDCASYVNPPWDSSDIGEPSVRGGAAFDREGGCLSICGGGKVLSGGDDRFHFVYREFFGDAVLSARIPSIEGAPDGAQVGVMLRENLAPDARCAAMTIRRRTQETFRFHYRPAEGEAMTSRRSEPAGVELPNVWLKITRQGEEFVGSVSPDGVAWQQVSSERLSGFSTTYYGGIVAIGEERRLAGPFEALDGQVCNIEIVATEPPKPFRRGDANADGTVDDSDAIETFGFLFLGTDEIRCRDAADSNDDQAINVSDAIFTLRFLFFGRAGIRLPPPAGCGFDPTEDPLGCLSYPPCE